MSGCFKQAMEWRERKRRWPGGSLVREISLTCCHLLPRPRQDGDLASWRFSFSRAENTLLMAMPEFAKRCYLSLKIIYKRELQNLFIGLKSYHLLTLFFWFLEEKDVSDWCRVHFANNLRELLQFVLDRLKLQSIPHYFIRSANLAGEIAVCHDIKQLSLVTDRIAEILRHRQFPNCFLDDEDARKALALEKIYKGTWKNIDGRIKQIKQLSESTNSEKMKS